MQNAPRNGRSHRGRMSFHAGLAAETRISSDYERRGLSIERRRWRGSSGEIDLVARNDRGVVFVEVKQSRSLDMAAQNLTMRQIKRLYAAADEYLAEEGLDQMTDVRFDVALVDQQGQYQIVENAFA